MTRAGRRRAGWVSPEHPYYQKSYPVQPRDVAKAKALLKEAGVIAESEHFAQCIAARPSNREWLLGTDVEAFIAVMEFWRECFLQSAKLPIVGASEADLNAIKAPACLIAGNDVIHTPATARKGASLIPNSELHDDVVEKRSYDKLLKEWDRKEWRDAEPRIAGLFAEFMQRNETRA